MAFELAKVILHERRQHHCSALIAASPAVVLAIKIINLSLKQFATGCECASYYCNDINYFVKFC